MPSKGAIRRGKARLQRGQCKTLAALFFSVSRDDENLDDSLDYCGGRTSNEKEITHGRVSWQER